VRIINPLVMVMNKRSVPVEEKKEKEKKKRKKETIAIPISRIIDDNNSRMLMSNLKEAEDKRRLPAITRGFLWGVDRQHINWPRAIGCFAIDLGLRERSYTLIEKREMYPL